MREIPLTQDKVALVDDEDYERVSAYKWCAAFNKGNWYAHRRVMLPAGKSVIVSMHRLIMGDPAGMLVDHINGDGLNCQRDNLRICNQRQNSTNKRKPRTNTSGYKGVSWSALHGKWRTRIKVGQKDIHIGLYTDLITAALAYDAAARIHHGEYARLNFSAAVDSTS